MVGFKGYGLGGDKVGATANIEYEGSSYTLRHGSVVIAAITSNAGETRCRSWSQCRALHQDVVVPGLGGRLLLSSGEWRSTVPRTAGFPQRWLRMHDMYRELWTSSRSNRRGNRTGHRADGSPVFLREIWPKRSEIHEVEDLPGSRPIELARVLLNLGDSVTTDHISPAGSIARNSPAARYLASRGLSPREFNSYGSRRGNDAVMARGAFANIRLLNKLVGKPGPKTVHFPSGDVRWFLYSFWGLFGLLQAFLQLLLYEAFLFLRFISRLLAWREGVVIVIARQLNNIHKFHNFWLRLHIRGRCYPYMDVFDAAERYQSEGVSLVALVGKDYGSGSSRDWAAKGPYLLGIKAVIAESYERIHRSNLVGMGLVPLQYLPEQNAESIGLNGSERMSITIPADCKPGQLITVNVEGGATFQVLLRFDTEVEGGATFQVLLRFDTEVDLTYFRHGGILNYMIRQMIA
ncbi:hypothetical protein B566_EDAN007771 [Ephemera danica]|nr:hypothetical protein B566_EDAN007771 [Ephemera danica]